MHPAFTAKSLGASITTSDLEKSVKWYTDVVGFSIDRKIENDGKVRAVALQAGEVRILLNQDDGKLGWDRRKGEGLADVYDHAARG